MTAADGGCASTLLSWSPSVVPGLVVWLDAAKGAGVVPGSPVSLWPDQSPAHNDASQSTSTEQPILEASAIGGLPAVRFDGNTTFLSIADSNSIEWGTGDFAVEVIARFSVTLGNVNQALFQKSTRDAPYDGPQLFVNAGLPSTDTTAMAALSSQVYVVSSHDGFNDAPHLFGVRRFGTTLEVRADGTSEGETSAAPPIDVSAPGMPAIIGQNGYVPNPGSEALQGDIAEVVAVRGTVSDSDLRSLECHLMLKYGL
jgi:hypothetical protein